MKEYNIANIPAALLLEVTEIATVYSAKLTKNKDLIMLQSTSGATKNMTKAEFVAQKFCTINGKEVRLISMKAGKDYLVYHIVNRHSFAVKVPRGNKGVLIQLRDNAALTAGKALVIDDQKIVRNDDGTYDLSAGHVMSEAIFRKTCILRSVSNELLAQIQNKAVEDIAATTTAASEQIQSRPTADIPLAGQTFTQPAEETTQQPVAPSPTQTRKPVSNKGRIVSIVKDRRGKTVGYYVHTTKGDTYMLNEQQVIGLCEKDAIENATVVHDIDKVFLRGVGCSLSELPITVTE